MTKTLKASCWMLALLLLLTSQIMTQGQEQPLPPTLVPAERLADSWWRERHENNKARIEQGNVDFLLVGDSITNGWDGAGQAVQEYYYGDRNYVNMGFGGDQTQHVLWRLNDAPMEKIHPKAAMLLIGINNLWQDWDNCSENVALGIKACVDKLQSLYPDIKILVLNIFPAHEKADSPVRARAAATNALLPEMFEGYKNIIILDINHLWLDENGNIPKDLMGDFVHPGEYGYKLWAAEVEPIIARMLDDEPKAKMK